jgi:hypothetical protein
VNFSYDYRSDLTDLYEFFEFREGEREELWDWCEVNIVEGTFRHFPYHGKDDGGIVIQTGCERESVLIMMRWK